MDAYDVCKHLAIRPFLRVVQRPRLVDMHHLPLSGPVIIASNHIGFTDPLTIAAMVPRRMVYAAKKEWFETPGIGFLLRMWGQIPLDRAGGERSRAALGEAQEVLEDGGVLGIFPEGTRSPDGRLYRGHTGIGRLVVATGACVVPAYVSGTRPWDGQRATITFGAPLGFPELVGSSDPQSARQITDAVMRAIGELGGQDPAQEYVPRKPKKS